MTAWTPYFDRRVRRSRASDDAELMSCRSARREPTAVAVPLRQGTRHVAEDDPTPEGRRTDRSSCGYRGLGVAIGGLLVRHTSPGRDDRWIDGGSITL